MYNGIELKGWNMNFKALCDTHHFGAYKGHEPVYGGLLNKMYKVIADQVYAVKIINPEVAKRPGALDHHEASETYGADMIKAGIAGVSAKLLAGKYVQSQGDVYYLVYPWLEGQVRLDVDEKMAETVGGILKRLHHRSKKTLGDLDHKVTDWDQYAGDHTWQLKPFDLTCLAVIEEDLVKKQVTQVMTHRDLDPKNIMWQGDRAYVIDWEASGHMNPSLECLEGALYFSESQQGYDYDRFRAFIRGYGPSDRQELITMLPYVFKSKLGWLKYSLEEGFKGSDEAMKEAQSTMALIHRTVASLPDFRHWLEEEK